MPVGSERNYFFSFHNAGPTLRLLRLPSSSPRRRVGHRIRAVPDLNVGIYDISRVIDVPGSPGQSRDKQRKLTTSLFELRHPSLPSTTVRQDPILPPQVDQFSMRANLPTSSWAQPTALELQSARAQLAAEERNLQLLLAQVEAARDRIVALKQVIAPIRRVPPEVLGEIIARCATAPDAPAQVLRTLSSVCRFWHDTTLKTPDAWSKIHFQYETKTPPGPRIWLQTLRDVQEWFRNSGKSKKDVRVSVRAMPGKDLKALLGLIDSHSGQLRILAMDFIPKKRTKMLNRLLAKPMPCLEEWSFYGTDFPPMIPRQATAPALRRLLARVQDLECMAPPEREQLTYLGILTTTSPDLAPFINLCGTGGFPALRVLSFHDFHSLPELPNGTSITLPALEALHMPFNAEDADLMVDLFSRLRMPNLVTLSLSSQLGDFLPMEDYHDARDASAQLAAMLNNLIDKSTPRLRRLYFESMSLLGWDLEDVLKRLPLLERLALVHMPITESFQYSTSRRCPRLTHLYFVPEFNDPEYRALEFRDMAAAVQAPTAKPTHARIHDVEMVEIDGKTFWRADEHKDGVKHPEIFRDAYLPFDRWWRMDANIIGSDVEGL
ncbi:hypothetical protein AURDEDRAFT_126704 [Auricularia subglabra TFB-10046 SS5]|nr:hypothetical protein AURDEDRAFT_126704 [Auricularia subglabra TFB-10046 SS5]